MYEDKAKPDKDGDTAGAKMNKEKTELKFKCNNIRRIMRFFGLENVVVVQGDYGGGKGMVNRFEKNRVYINKNLGDVDKILTLVHELIHSRWCLHHNSLGSYCGFYSTKHDHLSETIASIIFKRKLVWESGGVGCGNDNR